MFNDIKGIDVASRYNSIISIDKQFIASSGSIIPSTTIKTNSGSKLDISLYEDTLTSDTEGNQKLISIIQNEKGNNEIDQRLLNALNWIGLSIAEKNNAIALVQATFAIECLLQYDSKGIPINKSIVASLSESIAILLGDSFQSRKEYEKKFKSLYSLRSKIAHGKGNDVTVLQVLDAIDIAKKTVVAILTNPEIKEAKTIQMINNYVERVRYTYKNE